MKQKSIRLGLRVRWWFDFLCFVITEAVLGPIWYLCRYYRSVRERKVGDALLMEALAAKANCTKVLPVVQAWLETQGAIPRTFTWTVYPTWEPGNEYIVIRSSTAHLKLTLGRTTT